WSSRVLAIRLAAVGPARLHDPSRGGLAAICDDAADRRGRRLRGAHAGDHDGEHRLQSRVLRDLRRARRTRALAASAYAVRGLVMRVLCVSRNFPNPLLPRLGLWADRLLRACTPA